MKILIKNASIITMNPDHNIIKNGFIGIENEYITYVGQDEPEGFKEATVIEAYNKAVIPGIANTHTHTPMTLLRSYADDLSLHDWLFNHIFPMEAKLNSEDIYWGSMLAVMEMLSSGTTCFADMYYFMDRVAQVVGETGIKANLSRGMINPSDEIDADKDERLVESVNLFKEYNNSFDGRIKVYLAPHALYTCSPKYIEAICDKAHLLKTGIHVHVDETKKEHDDCIAQYKKTPVEHLEGLGVFELPTIAAHCVHLTDSDLQILKERNVTIAHNPTSNLKLGSGIAPIPSALFKGINVTIGTDGASSNNNLNMFEEMHIASLIHKGVNMEPTLVKAEEVLMMATKNGVQALGFEDSGVIKEGYKADLVIINTDKPHLSPMHKLTSNLIYAAQSSDVETVLVNGKILYNMGEYLTIDKEKVNYNINKIFNRLF